MTETNETAAERKPTGKRLRRAPLRIKLLKGADVCHVCDMSKTPHLEIHTVHAGVVRMCGDCAKKIEEACESNGV